MDGEETEFEDGFAIVVPSGVSHNVINTGDEDLKLYYNLCSSKSY